MAQPVRVKDEAKKWFDASTTRYFFPAVAHPNDEVLMLTVRGNFLLSRPIPGTTNREYAKVNATRAKQWLEDAGLASEFMAHMETFDPADEV